MASMTAFYRDLANLKNAPKGRFMYQAAEHIVSAAVGLCPVGPSAFLQNSIGYSIQSDGSKVTAYVGTNAEYALYVEYGTGPIGAAHHEGVSPDYSKEYRPTPWLVPKEKLDPDAIKIYNWEPVHTKTGLCYRMYGQAAQPFLYPAVKDNEHTINSIIENGIIQTIGGR